MTRGQIESTEEIFRSNINALAKVDPDLARRLAAERWQRPSSINLRRSPDGHPVLKITREGRTISYYGNGNPVDAVDREFGRQLQDVRAAGLLILFGHGLGFELSLLLSRYASRLKTQRLIVIERDLQLFLTSLHLIRQEALLSSPAVTFIVGEPEDRLYARLFGLFQSNKYFVYLKTTSIVNTTGAMTLAADYYKSAARAVRDAGVSVRQRMGNDPYDSLIGLENMLLNARTIAKSPGINLLEGVFRDVPGIVVATGPSLKKNIDLLASVRDKAVIVAADASVPPLLSRGIRPHIVTSIERSPGIRDHLKGQDLEGVYYACVPISVPEIYEETNANILIVYRTYTHFQWIGVERGRLQLGPSVGNMAFKVAEYLGCNPIILVGQDLAFGPDGRTHAEGTAQGDRQEFYHQQSRYFVKGNYAEEVETTDIWFSFLKYYEHDVAGFRGQCINATEGGAYIPGTQVMTLREALDRCVTTSIPVEDAIRERLAGFDVARAEQDFATISEVVQRTIGDLDDFIVKCKEYYEFAKEMDETYGGMTDEEMRAAGTALTLRFKELEKAFSELTVYRKETWDLFLAHIVQPFHLSLIIDLHAMPRQFATQWETYREIAKRSVDYFGKVHDMAVVSRQLLIDTAEKSGLLEAPAGDRAPA